MSEVQTCEGIPASGPEVVDSVGDSRTYVEDREPWEVV